MEQLFDYLKKILYEPENAKLELQDLPIEQREMGEGLQYLGKCVEEQRRFVKALSKGLLDVPLPSADNPLTGELRTMQSALKHLTWQARQVAKGAYRQQLDFMGELSDVFNMMTSRLAEREKRLEHEASVIRQQYFALQQGQNFLIQLTEQLTDWVVVTDETTDRITFSNLECRKVLEENTETHGTVLACLKRSPRIDGDDPLEWETVLYLPMKSRYKYIFEIRSQRIQWDGQPSISHMMKDVTKEREMEFYAYHDPLTQLYNRRFVMKEIESRLRSGTPFSLAFLDMDRLKTVNDTYGHDEGDRYIQQTAQVLSEIREPKLICRIGGDEFLIVAEDDSELSKQLETIREDLLASSERYRQSFSYGVVKSNCNCADFSSLIHEADLKMYEYKMKNSYGPEG